MKKWLGPLAFCFALGLSTHLAIIHYAPSLIMDRAYTMLGERGTPVHGFNLAPQMRPGTQSVVRPSPDLAYSGCRFDLTRAPNGIRVTMAAYDGYSSLSFFDAETNNFMTIRGNGEARETKLLSPFIEQDEGGGGATIAPSEKGIILIRRLAPTQKAYDKVVEASVGDACEAI